MKRFVCLLAFSFSYLIFGGYSIDSKSKKLDNWIGSYEYEEEPVKAIAGYYMAMQWTLSVTKQNKIYKGILEVNGQQTYIKLLTDIVGDKNSIAIVYNSLIDGSDENLKKGERLFTLSISKDKIETYWHSLESRLSEKPPKECNCFVRIKNNRQH
jgi:hypothetical protein